MTMTRLISHADGQVILFGDNVLVKLGGPGQVVTKTTYFKIAGEFLNLTDRNLFHPSVAIYLPDIIKCLVYYIFVVQLVI